MHIRRISIKNIRSIDEIDWKLPEASSAPGWHVIIGDNGAGKTSFLRSIALALIGPAEPGALRQDWRSWLRNKGEEPAQIRLHITQDTHLDRWSGTGRTSQKDIEAKVDLSVDDFGVAKLVFPKKGDQQRTIWARGLLGYGWFSAGYGPFRRFEGGDQDSTKDYFAFPEVARHLSLFGESVALTEALTWLKRLKHQKLESGESVGFIDRVKEFINTAGLLPHGTQLHDVTFDRVTFLDGNGVVVPVGLLGDGFRSILSMTFELLRQLEREFGQAGVFAQENPSIVVSPGVVLIDEVDAHLHPSWQRQVGKWFTSRFPNMQFFVTTHSPLVCWSVEQGTIFRLPAPGSEEQAAMIEGEERLRLVSGTVQDAYSTALFGLTIDRAPEAQERLEKLAELNLKQAEGNLTDKEIAKQDELKASLPSTAYTITPSQL